MKKYFYKSLCSKLLQRSFVIQKVKNTVPLTYAISYLNEKKKLLEHFMKKNCKKKNK